MIIIISDDDTIKVIAKILNLIAKVIKLMMLVKLITTMIILK
jgi:hypothetical protein